VTRFLTLGKCAYCSGSFSGTIMARHLESCKVRHASSSSQSRDKEYILLRNNNKNNDTAQHHIVYLLKVSSNYFPEYWLFMEADGMCKLEDIDSLLRDMWLECCGHLSRFTINNQRYEIQPDPWFSSRSMRVKLNKILEPGMIFEYVYDYGSSTELIFKVISSRLGKIKKGRKPIRLVARNDPILFKCHTCKEATATNICSICRSERSIKQASFCDNCLKLHECGEDMALPIVNSPRSGECGYTG
jgi:hypothetical protein